MEASLNTPGMSVPVTGDRLSVDHGVKTLLEVHPLSCKIERNELKNKTTKTLP